MNREWEEKVRQRAYQLWERDGFQHGRHDQHWEEAVRELERENRADFGAADDTNSATQDLPRASDEPARVTSGTQPGNPPAIQDPAATALARKESSGGSRQKKSKERDAPRRAEKPTGAGIRH